ncbi:hypothetical protein SAMN05421874_11241 [Nonomuraea maritima]|uniref:DUF5709 domain-containing protein n=1 Tax=Nonomuraea maritima TaxID=683260 RepID=A0A1G9FCP2_9ACTN|nr:DUF5709 domain-containing protein [Nonomuraea maritima]SDK86148.1 hypothetical protein SAMN05421874_11241 [Nonomuraea maritima]
MTETPPNRYGMSDEQQIEVDEWTDDLGLRHEIVGDDPRHRDTLDERLRREAPERLREPRPKHRLTQPDAGAGADVEDEEVANDWGRDDDDLSAEERAVRIDPEEDLR